MSLYTLIIVTFVIFMAINVIIGLRGRKHASTTKDFLTASGQSGIWFIIASAVGASIGSGVVIGTTQYAVKLGVAGAWYAIACGLACIVHAFVMTRFIYRNKLVSFSDYFKRRYDSNFIVLLYSGIGPFACAASMGGQLVAAKAIFQAFLRNGGISGRRDHCRRSGRRHLNVHTGRHCGDPCILSGGEV